MTRINRSDSEHGNESKTSKLKNILNQIFSRNDTLRNELIDFFDDKDIPLRNDQLQMILGVIKMMEYDANNVKVPITKVVSISAKSSLNATLKIICKTGHSRIPVYEEDGGKRKYVGLLYAKDILKSYLKKIGRFKLKDYIREVKVIPETQSLLSLLRDMRVNRQHMMLTANEYGDITGLITLEDLLEEIVGEIKDEYDSAKYTAIKTIGHRLYEVDASTSITDINKELMINLPEEKFNTLAGFLLHELKGNISQDATVNYGNIVLSIKQFDGQHIIKASVYIPPDLI